MLGPAQTPALKVILVELARSLSDWDYPDCAAPFWRLYWNARGRGIVGLGGRRHVLEGDAVLLIPPETHFSARAESPMDHLYVHFLAGPPFDAALPCVSGSRAGPAELAALRALARAAASPPSGPAAARAWLLRAASLCLGALARFPASRLEPADPGGAASRVAELVRSRLSAPPSNAELAAALGMSLPTLERRIRSATGRSLHAYALWLRIGEACIRLRHGDEPIERIAEELGFADRSHFSRAFAALRGESPASYRASSP